MTSTMLLQLGLIVIMIVAGFYIVVSSINEGRDDSLNRHNRSQRGQEREVGRRTNRPRPENVNSRKISAIAICCIAMLTAVSVIVGMTAAFRTTTHTVTEQHGDDFEDEAVITDYEQLEDGWSYIEDDETVQLKYNEYGEVEAMKLFDEDTGELWYYSTITRQGNPLQWRYYEDGEVYAYGVDVYEVRAEGTERKKYEINLDGDHVIVSFTRYDSVVDESEYTEIPPEEYDEYELLYDEDGFVCGVEEIQ